jgi:hypothetical protein
MPSGPADGGASKPRASSPHFFWNDAGGAIGADRPRSAEPTSRWKAATIPHPRSPPVLERSTSAPRSRSGAPAAVICQPAASRTTKAWLKMSKPDARAAMRFVRSIQSRPLDIRIATSCRNSASERRPSRCPARTFKTVIWKLIGRYPTPDQQSYLVACRSPPSGGAPHPCRAMQREPLGSRFNP